MTRWKTRVFNKTRLGIIPSSYSASKKWSVISRIIPRRGKLLDIGCGKGDLIDLVKQDSEYIVGIDINSKKILFSKIRFGSYTHIDFLVGDAYSLGVDKNSFDVVVILDVLEHLDKPEVVLGQVYNILTPGGQLIVLTPNWYNIFDVLRGLGPGHVTVHSSLGWRKMIERTGLKVISCRNIFFPIFRALLDRDFFVTNFHLFGAGVLISARKESS